ncbi:hypothetical protein O4J56_16215 [Nocardiopsis sp. RSe5-2]|uniref:DUF3093 domain-containing protein n=1 Tax=Nocardiopsis endophytica TaxID=3018445 RepID=A0ABT4U5G2_9ACTN|nr:hypothetical protein [Nocardiopsis endophytica]MDA2812191.1 hypothetical protein [Nocardiopsis endophytica]
MREQAGPTDSTASTAAAWVDLSRLRRNTRRWMWALIVLFAALPTVAVTASALAFPVTGGGTASLLFALPLWALLLLFTALTVRSTPRDRAPQGIRVDGGGLTLLQERAWWFGGREVSVPWRNVKALRPAFPPPAATDTVVVELRRGPVPPGLPYWARPLGGSFTPSPPVDGPALLLWLPHPHAARLRAGVEAVRPGAWCGGAEGAPPAVPERAAPEADAPAPSHWMDLRGRTSDFKGWLVAAVFCAYITVGMAVLPVALPLLSEAPLTGFWDAAGFFGLFAALFAVFAVLTTLLARGLPRRAARQGVRVDAEGITLVQERKWWFPGVEIPLPWSAISGVRADSQRRTDGARDLVVAVDLHGDAPPALFPGWAVPTGRTVRILPGNSRRDELLAMVRDVRPDLVPS